MASRGFGPRKDGTGDRWEQGGFTYTVNQSGIEGNREGFYLSMQDNATGDKATWTYDADYNLIAESPDKE